MAKYSVELGDVAKSGLKIFNFEYDFYDVTKKPDFEKKFINHFRFREIGTETVGRFQHYLKCKCDETLPYYNMLFRTSLIDYEKTINYNLVETYTKGVDKTDSLIGNAIVDGTKNDINTIATTLVKTDDIINVGQKLNVLNSTTIHTDSTDFAKNDALTETGKNDTTTTVDVGNKKVSSTTPSGLLAMTDIKTNVFASNADIEDNTAKTVDGQITGATKTDVLTETTAHDSSDVVNATSTDTNNDSVNQDIRETNSGTVGNVGTFGNTTGTTQNTTGTENENSTRIMKGSYGVITEADMLQKHITLQQVLSTILVKFFDECEDLFMQIY